MKTALPSQATSSSVSSAPMDPDSAVNAPGRPSGFKERVIDGLCFIIRETGISDSGAAARMSLHPSTVSRWKRACPDFALLLRTAREEFRQVQLDIVFQVAQSNRPASLRAACWMLERVFPQDYAPRAEQRAKFQAMHEAECAREEAGEGEAEETIGSSDNQTIGGEKNWGEGLQNVQNADALAAQGGESDRATVAPAKVPAPGPAWRVDRTVLTVPELAMDLSGGAREGVGEGRPPGKPLQNVQNSPVGTPSPCTDGALRSSASQNSVMAGRVCPPGLRTHPTQTLAPRRE